MDFLKGLLIQQFVKLLKLSKLKKAVIAGLTAFFAAWELDILPADTIAKVLEAAGKLVDLALTFLGVA
jgi:hypothetical protein